MSAKTQTADWIAVDWGTSNLRVWMMNGDNQPSAEASSSKGMGGLSRTDFEPALLDLIEPYLSMNKTTPVLCAGMVGAREGWMEAQYLDIPCLPPNGDVSISVDAQDPRISVRILPGLKQIDPPDVMRGEETQVAGALLDRPDFEGVLCLPGTHTKWVKIESGKIIRFQTFVTGEMFALLSEKSVLRHSVESAEWDQNSFLTAVSDSLASPETVAGQMFGIRAGGLINGISNHIARARLSGLLIGAELAASRDYWSGENVAIIGAGAVSELYRAGLDGQDNRAVVFDVSDLTLAGLCAAYNSQKGNQK